MNVEKIRSDFPIFGRKDDGKRLIYFDNAATSLKPKPVLEALNDYYTHCTANIHRGVHKLSQEASEKYENSHKKVAKFIGAKEDEMIFTRNASESFNLLMYSLYNQSYFSEGDEILISAMEHHSNIIPWQFLEKKVGVKLVYAELNDDYSLNMDDYKQKISEKTKLVSMTHASNTVATITPIKEIGKIAKDSGALFVVDGAQSIPHMKLDVKDLGADFLAFSGHKMLAPTGIGGLFGKKELLEKMPPFMFGGDMILSVERHSAEWNHLPHKFEAGTPHIAGGIGLGAAVDYLEKIGMDEIRNHEKEILAYALDRVNGIDKVKIYNPMDPEKQGGIVLFAAEGIEAHDLALALDESANIAIRSGMHCAEPLVSSLNPKGLDRASFYLYNTKEEVDIFADQLEKIVKTLG